jgi:hypothetical protein
MSLSVKLKRIFLSFAQQYFRDVPTPYKWDADPKKTKIFIGDSFAAKSATLEKSPAIILKANPKRWGRTSLDQRQDYPGFGFERLFKVRSDLVVSSMTYQCLSTNAIEAEMVADVLFSALVAYKDQFRGNGIHQLMDIQMGEQTLIRSDSVERLYAVGVTVFYASQETLITSNVQYEVRIYSERYAESLTQAIIGADLSEEEYLAYTVSGQTITFNYAPVSGLVLNAQYIDSITLLEKTEQLGIGNGNTLQFVLTSIPYFAGYMLGHVEFTNTVTIT